VGVESNARESLDGWGGGGSGVGQPAVTFQLPVTFSEFLKELFPKRNK
jgi:hypothetical protein